MASAVLYRHWLEIRDRTGGAVALGVLLSLADFAANMVGARSGDETLPLLVHVACCTVAALYGGFILVGTGVRTDTLEAGHPSLYYTLALPVARVVLVCTRFVIALAVTAALFLAMLASVVVARFATGNDAAFGTLVQTTVMMSLLAIAVQALGVLITMWDDRLRPLAFTATLTIVVLAAGSGASIPAPLADGNEWLRLVMAVTGGRPLLWIGAGVAALTTALSLTASFIVAYAKDF